jgi:hypothetical protein
MENADSGTAPGTTNHPNSRVYLAGDRDLPEPFGMFEQDCLQDAWRSETDERYAATEQIAG